MDIYIDNASTTKPNSEVINVMMPYMSSKWYNPSSLYSPSVNVKHDIQIARSNVANFLNANDNEIYFTSCGSESNSWVIQGFIRYWKNHGEVPVVVTTSIEHKSIIECVDCTSQHLHYVGVDRSGNVDIKVLESVLKSIDETYKILVSIQYANNEIGTIQNIKDISNIVHKYNGVLHTDAVQVFGRLEINVKQDGIDMLSASGHKIGTPKGIGILYKKECVNILPIIFGSQMDGMRGGTENVPYIIGFSKAVDLCRKNMHQSYSKTIELKKYFIEKLTSNLDCRINGNQNSCLANNINVTFNYNINSESLIYMLDMCNIYVSSGSACNSRSVEPSHVLKAIGLSDEEANRTIRFTISDDISTGMIDMVVLELTKQIKLLCIE